MLVLGVIPARAGSKGIPSKNTCLLNGIHLIQYTIWAADESDLDDYVITTDMYTVWSDKVLRRPSELAQDDTPMLPVVLHAVSEYEKQAGDYVDAVMLLQPTSPLRTAEDINTALAIFKNRAIDSLVSVCEGIHPMKSYGSDFKPFFKQDAYDKHKHKCFTRNGAIFITSRKLLDNGRLFSDTPTLYVMPKIRSIDIDDYDDLQIAEALLIHGRAI